MGDEQVRGLRAARREFIRGNHPDVGGDPLEFEIGLRRFDRALRAAGALDVPHPSPAVPLRVRRSNRPGRVVRRLLRRALGQTPRRHLE